MSEAAWRYARASVVGTSHTRTGASCQDASNCVVLDSAEGPVLVAVVADGAGSAPRGALGAELACSLMLDEISALAESGGAVAEVSEEFVAAWLTRFQSEVDARAAADLLTARAYACTVLGAVVAPHCAALFQVGDGAIVYSRRGELDQYHCMFWPQKGEYENQTFFATDPAAADHLDHAFVEWRLDELALFSDGLQRLALHFETHSAYAPFFSSMFAPVRRQPAGQADELSAVLASYLSSEAVNARTDDDKTLVLATRRDQVPTGEEVPTLVDRGGDVTAGDDLPTEPGGQDACSGPATRQPAARDASAGGERT